MRPASVASSRRTGYAHIARMTGQGRCAIPWRRAESETSLARGSRDHGCADRRVRGSALDHGRDADPLAAEQTLRNACKRLVSACGRERLQKHSDETVAAYAETPDFVGVVAQIVSDCLRQIRSDGRARTLGEIALETAPAHEALIITVGRDQDALAGLAVGRPQRLIDGGEHYRLTLRAPSLEGLNYLANTHLADVWEPEAGQYASAGRRLHPSRAST